ncbi:hypothetical protein GQ457_03G009120 [Hibiscus cannabinus]
MPPVGGDINCKVPRHIPLCSTNSPAVCPCTEGLCVTSQRNVNSKSHCNAMHGVGTLLSLPSFINLVNKHFSGIWHMSCGFTFLVSAHPTFLHPWL